MPITRREEIRCPIGDTRIAALGSRGTPMGPPARRPQWSPAPADRRRPRDRRNSESTVNQIAARAFNARMAAAIHRKIETTAPPYRPGAARVSLTNEVLSPRANPSLATRLPRRARRTERPSLSRAAVPPRRWSGGFRVRATPRTALRRLVHRWRGRHAHLWSSFTRFLWGSGPLVPIFPRAWVFNPPRRNRAEPRTSRLRPTPRASRRA